MSSSNQFLVPQGSDKFHGAIPAAIESPLKKLTSEQQKTLNELRDIANSWELTSADKAFIDDMCLFRYLSGLKWDLKIASDQLKDTLKWRNEFKPWTVRLKDLAPIAKQGFLYQFGYDKQHRPIIYVLLGKDTSENSEENKLLKFKFFVYIMEKCIARMPEGVHNILWIVDMKGSSLSLGLIKDMKDMFVKLGDYYTERLARCMVLNAGWTLNMIWSFVKPFLAQETIDKYVMVKGSAKDTIEKYVDLSQVIEEFDGKCKYTYDFAGLVADEQAEDDKRAASE
jgi:hypothetical protein